MASRLHPEPTFVWVKTEALGKMSLSVFILCYVNGDVVLEDDVLVGPFCCLTSNTHLFNTENQNFRGKNKNSPIRVGKGSWLGSGVTVTSGVKIGTANLVAANATVTKDTQDYSIIGGTPGRLIGKINPQTGDLHWFSSPKTPGDSGPNVPAPEIRTEANHAPLDDSFKNKHPDGYINYFGPELEREKSAKYKAKTKQLKAQNSELLQIVAGLQSAIDQKQKTIDLLVSLCKGQILEKKDS